MGLLDELPGCYPPESAFLGILCRNGTRRGRSCSKTLSASWAHCALAAQQGITAWAANVDPRFPDGSAIAHQGGIAEQQSEQGLSGFRFIPIIRLRAKTLLSR